MLRITQDDQSSLSSSNILMWTVKAHQIY